MHDRPISEEALAGASTPDGPALAELRRVSQEHDVVVVVGFAESADHTVYNSAVVIDRGATAGTYRKVNLWGEEPRWFTASSAGPLVVPTSAGTLGVMVCYDLEFPEWVRQARQLGVELVCAPVNWPALQRPRASDRWRSSRLRPAPAATACRSRSPTGSAWSGAWTGSAGRPSSAPTATC
ncbi:nitrilase-related carbon-nitrogen hydrolase [Arsenicicoccus piscis]|uniref:CN hydrolase domain-containing protein n=1 Tax=Arsenicicoccus piscis TaxID=673954 RepID=A0ABQ6HUV3_9MICO|nr:nitrilase-related carbon-nitrogen hydrolase [Arsenicicoccus piscis]GMA21473.1 hypothetical protein GCM10025862_34940 [Arsenicicoccus piscis]